MPGPQHRALLGRADPAGVHAAGDGVLPRRGPVPRHAEGLRWRLPLAQQVSFMQPLLMVIAVDVWSAQVCVRGLTV